jgi:DNA-binding IclR family transcriptional regulator
MWQSRCRRAAGWWSWGRLQQRSWTAEDGSARSVVEVVRDHLEEIRDETGYSVPAGVADEIASLVERLR